MAEYNIATQNDGSTGIETQAETQSSSSASEEVKEVAPDSNVQVGAQDTSMLSGDGSGRTIDEVKEQVDKVGDANGQVTAENVGRLEEDQKHQEEVQADVEANKAADEAWKQNKADADEKSKKSRDELNDMFLNGDI